MIRPPDMPTWRQHGKRSFAAIVTSYAERAQELRDEFALFDDWRDKLENVMDLGKALPPMEPALKTDASRVQGCQSQVWMVGTAEDGRIRLHAESDAILVKGLIALLLRLYDRLTPQEILDNPPEVLKEIGLERYLTPSRSNGLYAMIGRIQAIASAQAGRA
jgi:cysteine desulfuration protein SufE